MTPLFQDIRKRVETNKWVRDTTCEYPINVLADDYCDDVTRLLEALDVAVKALMLIEDNRGEDPDVEAKQALEKIKELGK